MSDIILLEGKWLKHWSGTQEIWIVIYSPPQTFTVTLGKFFAKCCIMIGKGRMESASQD